MRSWTWWQGGIALGLLSTLAMVLLKPMGVSTVFPSSLGIVLKPLFPGFVEGCCCPRYLAVT